MTKKLHKHGFYFLLVFTLILAFSGPPAPSYAASFTVDDLGDAVDVTPGDGLCETASNTCTLRAAIQEANSFPGDDVILLPAGTITLSIPPDTTDDNSASGDLDIRSTGGSVTIVGMGIGNTVIDGGGQDRIFHVKGAVVDIRDVTLQNGISDSASSAANSNQNGFGGAIYNQTGTVTIRSSHIRSNSATDDGGAIYNEFGTVNILENTTIGGPGAGDQNTATNGGGIYSQYSAMSGTNRVYIEQSVISSTIANTGNGGGILTSDDGSLEIVNSTIEDNLASSGAGGGIYSFNTVVTPVTEFILTDSIVQRNSSGSGGAGITILDIAAPTITSSTITDNTAVTGTGGILFEAALNNNNTTLTITNSTISENTNGSGGVGGVANIVSGTGSTSTLNLNNSTVSDNSAPGTGGVYNGAEGILSVSRTTISGNAATDPVNGLGGGITNDGTATVEFSTLDNNSAALSGGGILNTNTLTINNSTLSANRKTGGISGGGGGLANINGTVTIDNSTFSGNSSNSGGGGIFNNSGTIDLTSVTIANNSASIGPGGGMLNFEDLSFPATSIINFGNTIVGDNSDSSGQAPDCSSPGSSVLNSNDFNLIEDTTGCTIAGVTANNLTGVDPQIDPLAFNGGPTQTHRLQSGSQAIDAGFCNAGTDQRGSIFIRPIDIASVANASNGCDMGAYEVQSEDEGLIGDYVWNDINANGEQDFAELGIAGITVNLYLATDLGTVIDTTTTDGNGFYSFSAAAGTYVVEFEKPDTTWEFSPFQVPGVGEPNDSDADTLNGLTTPIILSAGSTVDFIDAGLYQPSSLGDFVWEDTNGNGVQDVGEPGVPGVIVELYRASDDARIASVSTDADGLYLFENIPPTTYYLVYQLPSGYELTIQTVNTPDGSDPDPATNRTANFVLNAGDDQLFWDAGLIQITTVGDFVWDDTNGDGLQGPFELGIDGVTVTLYDSGDNVIDTATTGDNPATTGVVERGWYSFSVAPGTYYVEFDLPSADWVFSPQDQGADDGLDSDPDPATGQTPQFSIVSGTIDLNVDAGMYRPVTIGDLVWDDLNANGIRDGGEPGLPGATVNLYESGDLINPIDTTTTTALGNYEFVVPSGTYVIEVLPPLGPPNYVYSPQDQGADDTLDSDISQSDGRTDPLALSSEDALSFPDIDAGLHVGVTISGLVWEDQNLDGSQLDDLSNPEPGRASVTVQLLDSTGTTLLFETVTDSNGEYTFVDVPAGPLILKVIPPPGFGFTAEDATVPPNDDIDSDVNQFTGELDLGDLSPPIQPGDVVDFDAGLIQAVVIGDRVWEDLDADGIQDPGEPGLDGVEVNLIDGVSIVATQITTAGGNYSFVVQTGTDYTIRVNLPSNAYAYSPQDQGTNDALDSDVSDEDGTVDLENIPAADDTIDAGLVPQVSVTGFVWQDLPAVGVQDGEVGLPGIEVRLLKFDDGLTELYSETTDGSGNYDFGYLPPAIYILEVVPPTGFGFSPQDAASPPNDEIDSDVNEYSGRLTLNLAPGNTPDIDAGLVEAYEVGDFVWEDSDADDLQGVGETGVPGVNIYLYDDDGEDQLASTTSDNNGNYSFMVQPGSYTIRSERPPNNFFSDQDAGGDGVDSDVDPATGFTDPFDVVDADIDTIDIGLQPTATVGDFVWEDLDANGIQDVDEPGFDNVTVNLYDATDLATIIDSTVTGDNPDTTEVEEGYYSFEQLLAGSYVVEIVVPVGYELTLQDVAGATEDLDSDFDPATLQTDPTALVAGSPNLDVDAGLFQVTSVSGFVWNDTNGDGLQTTGELGLANVDVVATWAGPDGELFPPGDTGDNVVYPTITTDATGVYSFTDLPPGEYFVQFTGPAGYAFTFQDVGTDDTIDSDPDPATGDTDAFTLESGTPTSDVDAGLYLPSTIQGYAWLDENGDGIQGVAETGLENVGVELFTAGGVSRGTTSSAADGSFSFVDIAPGDYYLEYTPLVDHVFSPQDQGADDTLDSDVDPATNQTAVFTVPPDTTVDDQAAGLFIPIIIGDYVWVDLNDDGLQDVNEPGWNGVTVELYNSPPGIPISTTITTNNGTNDGYYEFLVPPGDYVLRVVPPQGYEFTIQDAGGDDSIDSDPDPTTGYTDPFTANTGNQSTWDDWDAGLVQTATQPLTISKTAVALSPLPLEQGDRVGWIICVQNPNPDAVPGVLIEDTIQTDTQQLVTDNSPVIYGIGPSCPTTTPTTGDFYPGEGPNTITPVGDQISVTVTLQAGRIAILYFEVELLDPGASLYNTDESGGVLGMSSLFLALGGLLMSMNRRRRLLWVLAIVALLLVALVPQGLLAHENSDPSPAITQQENGRWVRFEIDSSNVNLEGFWNEAPYELASGGAFMVSDDPQAALDLNFGGSKIRIHYVTNPGSAAAQILVDNTLAAELTDFSNNTEIRTTQDIQLPEGEHSLRIQSLGRPNNENATIPVLAIDAIDVWMTDPPEEPGDSEANTSNLSGVVWVDSNENDLLDPDDRLLEDVTVFLYLNAGENDQLIDQTVTSVDGRYTFTNLAPDEYWVVIHRDTLPDDVDRSEVNWVPVPITAPYEGDLSIPMAPTDGIRTQITGRAWLDIDNNHVVSTADSALPNVPVYLYADDGDRAFDPSDNGDYAVGFQNTDSTGAYTFDNLLPGIYWVIVDTDNLPHTAQQNQTWQLLWVRAPNIDSVDLLLKPAPPTYSLIGNAWLDIDTNNHISDNDTALSGLTIDIYKDDGDNIFDETIPVSSPVTDAAGLYQADGLLEGVYWIIPDLDNAPDSVLNTQIWRPLWVRLPAIETTDILLLSAPTPPDIPDGPGILTGRVFNDNNGNRKWDGVSESGIRDTVVSLYMDNGDGEFNPGVDIEMSIAEVNDSGQYRFDGLNGGSYWVLLHESSLPENYMDTVAYGGHGDQNPQLVEVDALITTGVGSGEQATFQIDGPNFAYALDTDGDGSPDGREGSGDRDNDNIRNKEDSFDPTGIVYSIDPEGQTRPLPNVPVQLVYEDEDGQMVPADTIQPNPQQTGAAGEYRFDLNVSETGIPESGDRTFLLEVMAVPAEHEFPSELYESGDRFVGGTNNGQITPFAEIPTESPTQYYTELELSQGDADVVNNHLPVAGPAIAIMPTTTNTACASWDGDQQVCAIGEAILETEVDFTITYDSDPAQTAQPNTEVIYTHTLTNIGNQSDRYTFTFDPGTQGWDQELEIVVGTTTVATLQPGQSFTTDPIAPTDTVSFTHTITVPVGASNGDIDVTDIVVSSEEAADVGETLERTATNTTTIEAGCIEGLVFNDRDGLGTWQPGEGLPDVRLFILDGNEQIDQTTTDSDGRYAIDLPTGTYRVLIDDTSLPPGNIEYVDPTTPEQQVTVDLGQDCSEADFIVSLVNPNITKTASVATTAPGGTIVWTIVVTNPETSTAITNVTVTDAIDTTKLSYVSYASSQPVSFLLTPPNIYSFTIASMSPGDTVQITITTTVLDTVVGPVSISNTARMAFDQGDAQTTLPAIVNVPGEGDGTGDGGTDGDDSGTDGGGGGTDGGEDGDDFGEGGADVTGVGEAGQLPNTGYRPIDWYETPAKSTTNLSSSGQIFVFVVSLLSLIAAGVLYFVYNNSEAMYTWLEKRGRLAERLVVGVMILLVLFGLFGLVYGINDTLNIVDLDETLGLNDSDDDQQPDRVTDDAVEDDDRADDATTPSPTDSSGETVYREGADGDTIAPASLPRPDQNTRRVIIPALDLLTPLVESPRVGDTWDISVFYDEIAHLEGTAAPGTRGNVVLAGHITHRRGLGPFRDLDALRPGDSVVVKDYGVEYTYLVNDVFEVAPSAVNVTHDTDDAMLTLITCTDWNNSLQTYTGRLIVQASLLGWSLDTADMDNNIEGEQTRYEVGTSDEIELDGDWQEWDSYNTSDSSYFFTPEAGDSLTLNFEGEKVRIGYVMHSVFGEFEVYLDDRLVMTVDSYSEYSGFVTTDIIETYNGRHQLRIVNTGRANELAEGHHMGIDTIDVWK